MLAELGGNRGYGFDRVIRGRRGSPAGDLRQGLLRPGATAHLRARLRLLQDDARARPRHRARSCAACAATIGDRPRGRGVLHDPRDHADPGAARLLGHLLRALLVLQPGRARAALPPSPASIRSTSGRLRRPVRADRRAARHGPRPAARRTSSRPRRSRPRSSAFADGVAARPRALARLARASAAGAGQQTVLWGGGSKAVAFLTTLGIGDEIAYAVDINPQALGHLHRRHRPADRGARASSPTTGPTSCIDHEPDLHRRDPGPARRPGRPAGRSCSRRIPARAAPPPDTR